LGFAPCPHALVKFDPQEAQPAPQVKKCGEGDRFDFSEEEFGNWGAGPEQQGGYEGLQNGCEVGSIHKFGFSFGVLYPPQDK
jgi:hypothetical protein